MTRSRGAVAAQVAAQKRKHPELYCPRDRCLWRTGGGPCPRHPHAGLVVTSTDFDQVNAVAVQMFRRGAVLGARGFSVGRWTPALRSSYEWVIHNLQGSPLVLAYDAFEAARWFCDFESGRLPAPPASEAPIRIASDQELDEQRQLDAWTYDYRWSPIGGYGADFPGQRKKGD